MSGAIANVDWQERINFERLRNYRLQRAREKLEEHKLGALLCLYDENIRYITATLTPNWNKLKPGLRYVLLPSGGEPILYEQGDIRYQVMRHSPWLKKEHVRYSYAWIKGAAGAASYSQARKFAFDIKEQLKKHGVADAPLGIDLVDINMINAFKEANINWTDGMTPMMEARAIKSKDEIECLRTAAAIADGCHYALRDFMRPGLTENQITAFAMHYLYNVPGVEDVEDVIVSSGPNTWPNWRNFSDRIVRPGDILFIDLAAVTWNGYKTCYYRTYCIGKKPTTEQKETYRQALDWLYKSIEAVKPGATTADIAKCWPEATKLWGYESEDEAAANMWGHGLGLAQYDLPVVSRIYSLDFPYTIQQGMTFALETQHGKMFEYGVRIEEMLVVTETGYEILSKFPVEEITICD